MRRNLNFKRLAVALAVAAGVAGAPNVVSADEIVRVLGQNNQELGCYSAGNVSTIEFGEGTAPVADEYSEIVIPLSDKVQFIMVKVKGCNAYTLKSPDKTKEPWANGGATKPIEDFWIGKFEVTQGVWNEVMGSVPSGQSVVGDSYPAINVSWDDICGDGGFLTRLNALKESNPTLAAVMGDREFRLPSEWEWEYASAGGVNNQLLKYYYSGTSGNDQKALDLVAVNSVDPNNKANNAARVGSKQPNALWLYDMSGNVWEWCNGKGYPGIDAADKVGYLYSDGSWKDDSLSLRPSRGGSWNGDATSYFRVSGRSGNAKGYRSNGIGFRLAL